MSGLGLAIYLALGLTARAAEAPAFTKKPTAAPEDGKVVIRFAAPAPIDCAVTVLDAEGRVVRHLAAASTPWTRTNRH